MVGKTENFYYWGEKMALPKYAEILKMAKDKVKELMAPLRATEMKKKAELEISKLECIIAEKEENVQNIASQYPIDFDKMIEAVDELDLTKRRLSQFQNIIDELFN
jgi:hypothetical protein